MRLFRLESPAAGLVGLLILACVGCHAIFPFDNEEPDAGIELGVEDASAEALTNDAMVIDGPLADQVLSDQVLSDQVLSDQALSDAPPDQSPPDQATPDQAPPDQAALPDACWPGPKPPIASTCVDTEGAATNGCNLCPPADDGDCDGLWGPTAPQDPWPWNRNLLVVADGFKVPLGSRWTTKNNPSQNSASGVVVMGPTSTLTLTSSCGNSLPNPDYLAEVRYTMTTLITNTRVLNLHTPLQGKLHRLCRVNATAASTKLELELRDTGGATSGTSKNAVSLVLKQGTTLLLQSWSEKGTAAHHHHCRLLTGDGKKKLIHVTMDQALAYTGSSTLAIGGDGATYTLDYVRVYKR